MQIVTKKETFLNIGNDVKCIFSDSRAFKNDKLQIRFKRFEDNTLFSLKEEEIRELIKILQYYLENREIENYKQDKIIDNEPNRL